MISSKRRFLLWTLSTFYLWDQIPEWVKYFLIGLQDLVAYQCWIDYSINQMLRSLKLISAALYSKVLFYNLDNFIYSDLQGCKMQIAVPKVEAETGKRPAEMGFSPRFQGVEEGRELK